MTPGGAGHRQPAERRADRDPQPGRQDGGGALEWELVLAPGGRVPSSHAHPGQEECFTVLDGWLKFRIGGRG